MDINGTSSSLANNDTLAIQPPDGQEITGGREVDGNQGNNVEMNIVMNHQHDAGNSSGSNKQRKKRSKVWDEMIKFAGADGSDCARCIHCEKVFDGSSKKGTTHLNNHLETCRRKRNNNGGEDADKSIDQRRNFTSSAVIEGKSVTDLLKSCFDENGHFNSEYFNPSVLNSRKVEILQIYEEEKEKLRMVLSQTSCRFNLLIEDFEKWHILIVCYIDNNWESKMKIISVDDAFEDGKREHNYQNLVKFLRQSCSDMKIDGSICSISYHCWGHPDFNLFNKSDYEDVIGEIESEFSQRDIPHPFLGFLFPLDIVNLIRYNFEDNLEKWLWNKFDGIRKCIDYVNSTASNMRNFQIAIDNTKSMGKIVNVSDPFPKYAHSLCQFLEAVGYKEALCELERIDSDFKSRSINLTKEHWDEAAAICHHYKEFMGSIYNFHKHGKSAFS
ncbi:zinc finger BED domain-containing protein RICESLEEPER 2-like [Melia azedarach]|uniref:Zinc finger BED domain-containing protein RICESLEEPER 2-like n=2 Tax=Melia azedarach TaxID=155640 RepID=A0ACC1YID6_MELAZ|nr:zinc finger BED domain-containing protein RICESLEEPER 2-like [Melia azedarach]KAJ4723592.1 zinc finger BED domain-containing protein RICESLEEPER 2-like [Melia azedarach]